MNDDHPADPVGRITIHAPPHLSTGDINIESPGVKGGSHILYPLDPFLNIVNDLIVTNNKNHFSRPKLVELTRFPNPSILTSSPFKVMALELLRKRSEVICDFLISKIFSLKALVSNDHK